MSKTNANIVNPGILHVTTRSLTLPPAAKEVRTWCSRRVGHRLSLGTDFWLRGRGVQILKTSHGRSLARMPGNSQDLRPCQNRDPKTGAVGGYGVLDSRLLLGFCVLKGCCQGLHLTEAKASGPRVQRASQPQQPGPCGSAELTHLELGHQAHGKAGHLVEAQKTWPGARSLLRGFLDLLTQCC